MTSERIIQDFSFQTVPNIDFGIGAIEHVVAALQFLRSNRTLIVTDPGLFELGLLDPLLGDIKQNHLDVHVYSDVRADPPEQNVEDAVELARHERCDSVIGFGGGSAMDVAKLVAVLAKPENENVTLESMYGVEQFDCARLPLIQIPTTSGTGSEVTAVAIITTGETTKAGVVSSTLFADRVILDPKLTVGLPPHITAATGIDAMVHAIEAYTSKRLKNPMSDAAAIQSLSLIAKNLTLSVENGADIDARSAMLYAAMLAGQAFANAPVGGVHALAYPVGGLFHVPHGLINSLVLPHVLRFNGPYADRQYSELASLILHDSIETDGAEKLANYFLGLASDLGLPTRLRDVGVNENNLKELAAQAMLQQRLLINNPREMSEQQAFEIYSDAY